MGWGIGIGVGWPNNTSGGGGTSVHSFPIYSCSNETTAYSNSPSFGVGVYIYEDINLTMPFIGWYNSDYIGYNVYYVDGGLVTDNQNSCG
jgi:hypothetical protein